MPPVLDGLESDDDMDIPDVIPAKAPTLTEPEEEEEVEEGDSDEDEAEDEYRVESILKHDFAGDDDHVVYLIKWLGFEAKKDRTWEPLENLSGAPEILAAYHKKIGGAPVKPSKRSNERKRGASDVFADSSAPESGKKKTKRASRAAQEDEQTDKKVLPSGHWENDVTRITSVTQEDVPLPGGKGKTQKQLTAYLLWDTGHKTIHAMPLVRRKCPQKLLDYYEQHLVFTDDGTSPQDPKSESGANGDSKKETEID